MEGGSSARQHHSKERDVAAEFLQQTEDGSGPAQSDGEDSERTDESNSSPAMSLVQVIVQHAPPANMGKSDAVMRTCGLC
jgi:hypothetical protein